MFKTDLDDNYVFQHLGNNLVIIDETNNSSITIYNYYCWGELKDDRSSV